MRISDNTAHWVKVWLAIVIALAGAFMILSTTGCYTAKKAEKQVIKAHVSYPEVTALFCSKVYPVIPFTRDSIIYKPGQPIPGPIRYVTVNCDSVNNLSKTDKSINTKSVAAPCPPCETRVDTLYRSKETQSENTAKSDAEKLRADRLNEENIKLKDDLKEARTWNYILMPLCILLIMFTIGRLLKL